MLRHRSAHWFVAAALLSATTESRAQKPAPAEDPSRVTIVAGPQYAAGSFQRFLLGDNWRQLWTTPIRVPVLDLARFEGGLVPEEQGGGNQSVTLHMIDAGGEGWVFRSIDKFPRQGLPPELTGTPVGAVIGDGISALLPAGSLILPRLLEAVGILHVRPMLYVMPDDPRLGEYRDTFAGMLGGLEFKPNEGEDDSPGFAGSRKIKGSEEFLTDLDESAAYSVDAREYLAARLIDFLVGDTDRGTDQWRWARFGTEGSYVYRPIPRDRDWAFVQSDGVLASFVRSFYPKPIDFLDGYPDIESLTFSSHILDRRLLTELTRADFAETASRVRDRLTDQVIGEAVGDLPPEYDTQIGELLRARLVERRNRLDEVALRFYDWLATAVDIHATDDAERADIESRPDGAVVVRIATTAVAAEPDGNGVAADLAPATHSGTTAAPYYERIFFAHETDEVRIHLRGGADHARITGVGDPGIAIRVIGGAGDDVLEDRTGAARLYDDAGDNTFVRSSGTSVSEESWQPPDTPEGFRVGSDWAPDWGGSGSLLSPTIGYGDVAGIVIGAGPSLTRYGFRRLPYHWRVEARGLFATEDRSFGAEVEADYRFENASTALTLEAEAVQFESFRFYGFGNDTPELPTATARLEQDLVRVHPAIVWHVGPRPGEPDLRPTVETPDTDVDEQDVEALGAAEESPAAHLTGAISIGPLLEWTRFEVPAGNPLIDGANARRSAGQVGARAAIELARTDREAAPRRGFRLSAEASAYPGVWDAEEPFGRIAARLSGYLPLMGEIHLATRIGGVASLGAYPVYDAAFVGGRHSLRGFRSGRFAGDAAAFGGAELRVPLGTVPLLVRSEIGVFGLVDAARVWHESESPGGWHTGLGGGLWLSAFDFAVSGAFAHGESNRFYVWLGLPF